MKKLSVISQIIILITLMCIMGVTVGLFGVLKISQSNTNLNNIFEDSFLPFRELNTVSYSFGTIIHWEMEKLNSKESNQEIALNRVEQELTKVEELLNNLFASQNNPNEASQFQNIIQQSNNLKSAIRLLLSKPFLAGDPNNNEYHKIMKSIDTIQNDIDVLMDIQFNKALLIKQENDADFKKSKLYFAAILISGIALSMAIAALILMGIRSYLASTNRLIKKIASGDLSTKIERRGGKDFRELHDNLKLLSDKFIEILEITQIAANNIRMTSEELSSNAQMISDDANRQAATVEEIASSMEEISSHLQENTDNTLSTQIIYAKITADAELGSDNVKQTFDAIQSIAAKISIIGDIAFQTNILALNAAVEAARAGEHGKGFGVVAAEVGKLADRSKTAASEINALSQSGLDRALESRQLFIEFVKEIEKTSKLISQITTANLEQNLGIGEMNTAVQMLNQISQQNAASSEEMATVSEQMTAQSQILKESIHYFKFQKQTNLPKKKQTVKGLLPIKDNK